VLTSISAKLKNKKIKRELERMEKKTRHINGVKAYKVAGCWYADYNQYQAVRRQQGVNASIDVFCSWCEKYNLEPTG